MDDRIEAWHAVYETCKELGMVIPQSRCGQDGVCDFIKELAAKRTHKRRWCVVNDQFDPANGPFNSHVEAVKACEKLVAEEGEKLFVAEYEPRCCSPAKAVKWEDAP